VTARLAVIECSSQVGLGTVGGVRAFSAERWAAPPDEGIGNAAWPSFGFH
jgi:hypothetical protein